MENKVIDIEKVRRYLKEKDNRDQRKREKELKNIIKTLKNLSDIWKKYRVKKVYLYGSTAEGLLYQDSDIDIAVQGQVSFQDLLHLFSEIDRHFARDIDVRSLEELPFKEKVLETGVLVYEE